MLVLLVVATTQFVIEYLPFFLNILQQMEEALAVKRVHDYAKAPSEKDKDAVTSLMLPETHTKSPQLKMRRHTTEPSNAVLLEAIEKLGKKQDDFLEKLLVIENSVSCHSSHIAELGAKRDTIADKADIAVTNSSTTKDQLTSLKTENKQLWEKLDELEAYKGRWNLRIAGIPEEEGENVKMAVLEILRYVSPGLADVLQSSIDVAHRLGKKGLAQPRRIIVQFTSCTHRDRIWTDAKHSEILKQKNIRITEDLTQHAREARKKLRPLVNQARLEGKHAGFQGSTAVIDV